MEININEQVPSIKLIKGQKDSYGWEIKVFGKEIEKILEQLKLINDKLVGEYCGADTDDGE